MTQSYLQGLEEHWGQMYEEMAKDAASGGLLQEPANTLSLMPDQGVCGRDSGAKPIRQEPLVKESMTLFFSGPCHLGLTHILLRLLSFPLGSRGTGLADLLRMPAME